MPESFDEQGSFGKTNGTTPVEMVPATAVNQRQVVVNYTVHNRDTAVAIAIVRINDGVNDYIHRRRRLQPNGSYVFDGRLVIDDTSASLEIVLNGAVTTNELDFTCSWAETENA